MPDIFLSYSREDQAVARRFAEAFEGQGFSVWWDVTLRSGEAYDQVTEKALRDAKAVVVLWSKRSVESRWVRAEATLAERSKTLVPATIEACDRPIMFELTQTADLSHWQGEPADKAWLAFLADVKRFVEKSAPAAAPAPSQPKLSICVLPFANMSGEAEQEYFSDGITEDIITDLSKVSALSVVARNTAFTFKGKSFEVPQVARQLGVTHVLEGSVRKAGGRVRITAQLIDGAGGHHVWADRFDRNLDDIFALQDEISQTIVAALKLKLLPEEKTAIAQRGTDNAEAYNLYLMARRDHVSGHGGEAHRYKTIVRLCQRAVEIDPGYARAWALMAQAQVDLRYIHGMVGDGGLAAAEKALALDAGLAEAHAVRARLLADDGRHEEAQAEIQRAIALDPDSWEVNRSAALLEFRQRRIEDAIRYWEKATALMEGDINSPAMLTTCFTATGDHQAAKRWAQVTLARTEKVLAQDRSNGAALGYGCLALAMLGQAERSKDWMDRAVLIDPDNPNVRYNFACVLSVHIKDPDGAIEMLGPFFASAPAGFIRHAQIDPDLDPVRDDPRFKAMLAEAEVRMAAEKAAETSGDDGKA